MANEALGNRYGLPSLDVGIGLAWSKAIVTTVGHSDMHPKVIGECVYYASKLATERNLICTDKRTHLIWPTAREGIVRFRSHTTKDNIEGFIIEDCKK